MSQESPPWLNDLNPQQRQAVTHGEGPLLIVAGAGTGKTRTLAYRVACLVDKGVPPERILLMTFTRRAAEEMLRRAGAALSRGPGALNRVRGGTFHSIANYTLRVHSRQAGLPTEFTIIDRADAEDLMDLVRGEASLYSKDSRFPRKSTCMSIYSRCVNAGETLETVLDRDYPWCTMWRKELKALFRAYVERKQGQGVADYDDLLLYWHYLLQDDTLADRIGGEFDHILVDEYQDTNQLQAEILFRLRLSNGNITVVGDDCQSIYGFRSATVRNILDFPSRFPGTTMVTLDRNYRSTGPILRTTNTLISQAKERYSKELWSNRAEGALPQLISCRDEQNQDEMVIRKVLEHYEQGIPLHKQVVLFRTAYHSSSLELALTRANIPFHKWGGIRFLEAAHIKDLIALLRILENASDEVAWFRVLQLLGGVGPATAAKAFDHIRSNGFDATALASFEAPPAACGEIAALAELVVRLRDTAEGLSWQIEQVMRFYEPVLMRIYDDPEPRLNDLRHLAGLCHGDQSRTEFLTELVLDPPAWTGDLAADPSKDEDRLALSTIHSAKGLEWDVVYIIHAADGFLPLDMSTGTQANIEEELRTTYVAMTRARDFLYVLWPLRYYQKSAGPTDNHGYAQLCRFFNSAVLETMEAVNGAPEHTTQPQSDKSSRDTAIPNRIRDMWD